MWFEGREMAEQMAEVSIMFDAAAVKNDPVWQPSLQCVIAVPALCYTNKLFFFDSLNIYFLKTQNWPKCN